MLRFADLYDAIDRTTSTNGKVDAMAAYFGEVEPADAAWAVFILTGRKLKRIVSGPDLARWACARAGLQDWLFGETYSVVGDLAETIGLLIDRPRDDAVAGVRRPAAEPARARQETLFASAARSEVEAFGAPAPLHMWMEERLPRLAEMEPAVQASAVGACWGGMRGTALLVFNKLLTGGLRVGVSQRLVVRALAKHAGVPEEAVAQRLAGEWTPSAAFFEMLAGQGGEAAAEMRPYPFFLASPLEGPVEALGAREEWLAEWKWDGIRAQLIRRGGRVHLWSRGDELITERFPEIAAAAARIPDGLVLDGEVLAWRDGRAMGFKALQRRIGRLKPGAKVLAEVPAAFIAYDVLEHEGTDVRGRTMRERRVLLEGLIPAPPSRLVLSPLLEEKDWSTLAQARFSSRDRRVEGVMLKRADSPYRVGRVRGDWWKWKIAPLTIDAVLVYAQPGHGRRANLLTDYTFAVWDRPRGAERALVPVAKAYSGLDQEEIARLDSWIRQHTTERFGPVRGVEAVHVFELGFEAVTRSTRHRSGIAVRFPRILRWRADKAPEEADTLASLEAMIDGTDGG